MANGLLYNDDVKKMKDFPRYVVWSTDKVDKSDPFQRRWLLRQVLLHGKAEDIRSLDLDELAQEIDHLNLPSDIDRLWRTFFRSRHV